MKPYLPLLILFISCSKEKIPVKPVESISMTQTRIVNNQFDEYEKTMLVIHFHKVTDPKIIEQYKALPARQAFCDDLNDTLVTVIGKPCDINHKN